ncbi:2-amino-3-carboxymuconate-6-semialdehyde decarboxylase [Phytophthora cinnamomi]|uniref:2-amino-3-carboxymuconate-6-semialdehyde decarboxylase n=1 Tax=Phytophthora cinnamomi TaxID=4785 RepID=UPI00355A0112|nr:2-amino-3-carboxymuconate-6-semialdehyde decarboxylase [Phytophthora cinnamomi]
MPRPILKTLSSYASPVRSADSASKRDRRRLAVRRHTGASRRVTFSPFTKLRGDASSRPQLPLLTDGEETKSSLTSGFTFSSATEAEKKKQSRRKQELQTIQTLYRAARRRPHSVKSLLLAHVPGLKRLNTWATDWIDYAKAVRAAVPWPQRTRQKRRPRRLLRGPWTELDDADHKYVQKLALSSTSTHPTLLLPASTSCRGETYDPLAIVSSSPKPDLTPASRGSFSNLLRKEGIPVDEDVRQVNRAIDEDLRGVKHLAKRRRVQR